jgi:CheY-like chemotaxis protein
MTKILLVDDIPDNIRALFHVLTENGYGVTIAADGEDALESVRMTPPDLILLDIMMPGMDGFETCRRLKDNEATRAIPVIFMTALAEPVDKVRGFQLGAVDYITKPVHHEEALSRIKTHLTISRLQRELETSNARLLEKTGSWRPSPTPFRTTCAIHWM